MKKIPIVKHLKFYRLHWETEDECFTGIVMCLYGISLQGEESQCEFFPEHDYPEFVSLKPVKLSLKAENKFLKLFFKDN